MTPIPGPDRSWSGTDVDVDELVARKRAQGLAISVVLPTRNEAATVAGVVRACTSLHPHLVDEVVVLDGGSTDATVRLAEEAGAVVHDDSRVLADLGPSLGKGDALWRALAVTTGDLVCYVDTDIANPGPRFVTGLLLPLLHEPEVQLVKAYYERPIAYAGVLQPSGGGRVTELLARPLLNLFWPELAGLVQPLSGEYAGRRRLLEAIPFFTGYGVELGMLLDTLERCGPEAIAQVDLAERIHRNQPIEALSRMAFGILQVAARRLRDEGRLGEAEGLATAYRQFARTETGVRGMRREVEVVERPPFRSR